MVFQRQNMVSNRMSWPIFDWFNLSKIKIVSRLYFLNTKSTDYAESTKALLSVWPDNTDVANRTKSSCRKGFLMISGKDICINVVQLWL